MYNVTQKKHYKDVAEIKRHTELKERLMFPLSTVNYYTNGILFGSILLVMSRTNEGKTTLSRMILESAIKQGYKCFAMWGEEDEEEATDKFYSQHIPYNKENYKYEVYKANGKETNVGEYVLTIDKYIEAQREFSGKLFIYDNSLPPTKENVLNELDMAYRNEGCRVFLLDNLEILDIDTEDENKGVKQIMVALRRWAIQTKSLIILLSHIRKIDREVILPDIFDNKGTTSITNVCRNIIVPIRTDTINPNLKTYKKFKEEVAKEGYYLEELDGIVAVRKQKGKGNCLCGVRFNKYTNSYYEVEKDTSLADSYKNVKSSTPKELRPLTAEEQKRMEDVLPF